MVVFTLVCSLLVALTLVPMLASKFMTIKTNEEMTEKDKGCFQGYFERVENRYSNFLRKMINRKFIVFGTTAVLMAFAIYGSGSISTELAPQT